MKYDRFKELADDCDEAVRAECKQMNNSEMFSIDEDKQPQLMKKPQELISRGC
jgi:hypothetical protein